MNDPISIPRWALERACEAAGRKLHHFDQMDTDNCLRASIASHALTIAQHEAPPVSRKLKVAREAMARQCKTPESAATYRSGDWDYAGSLNACLTAVELWIEGFGE